MVFLMSVVILLENKFVLQNNMKESIIGKKYIPTDNSWSVNVTTASECPWKNEQRYLSGTMDCNFIPVECTIVSEPFFAKVMSYKQIREQLMIAVDYNNETHIVLFFPSQIQ